jgi:hypothetical protein
MINKEKTMNSVVLLQKKLSEMGVTRFNVFPSGNATPEVLAKVALSAIEQVEAGNFEDVENDD